MKRVTITMRTNVPFDMGNLLRSFTASLADARGLVIDVTDEEEAAAISTQEVFRAAHPHAQMQPDPPAPPPPPAVVEPEPAEPEPGAAQMARQDEQPARRRPDYKLLASADPRIVLEQVRDSKGQGFKRLNVDATLRNVGITMDELMNRAHAYPRESLENRLRRAVMMRARHATAAEPPPPLRQELRPEPQRPAGKPSLADTILSFGGGRS